MKIAKRREAVNRNRLENLRIFIGLCYRLIDEEMDLKEISNKTWISVPTLYRLLTDKLSLKVHFGTIQKLADAAKVTILDIEKLKLGLAEV